MDSYLVGNKAAQVVPIPPNNVNPPVSAINTIPMKRRNFAKKLFVDIAYSFCRKKSGHASCVTCDLCLLSNKSVLDFEMSYPQPNTAQPPKHDSQNGAHDEICFGG
jgi:hypothetical protein